ncbi:MAG: hypothetical protein RMY36_025720 [Nostoc sp. SerVER01]|nr:hypothetical protein [Nostoc sp. SerVER01]
MEATRFCEVGKKGAMPAGGVAIAHRKCPYFRLTVIILNFARSLPQLQSISQVADKPRRDYSVRSLYSNLQPDIFKVVKGTVQSTLTICIQERSCTMWDNS